MNLDVPLDYPDEQAVVDYLVATRDGFINVAQNPDARNLPYEMDVTAESFSSQQTRSLVLTLFQNVGSAHPTTWYKAFTYDLERGRPVTFDTLFAPDANPLGAIFPIVARDLGGQTGLPVFPAKDWTPGIIRISPSPTMRSSSFSAVPKCCRPTPGPPRSQCRAMLFRPYSYKGRSALLT